MTLPPPEIPIIPLPGQREVLEKVLYSGDFSDLELSLGSGIFSTSQVPPLCLGVLPDPLPRPIALPPDAPETFRKFFFFFIHGKSRTSLSGFSELSPKMHVAFQALRGHGLSGDEGGNSSTLERSSGRAGERRYRLWRQACLKRSLERKKKRELLSCSLVQAMNIKLFFGVSGGIHPNRDFFVTFQLFY
jgi:hypothetical protein